MKKLRIIKIDNYIYTMEDEDNNEYKINIEFINLDKKVSIGTIIYIPNSIFSEKTLFTFGKIGDKYASKISSEMNDEIIVLILNNEKIYLQRYYG